MRHKPPVRPNCRFSFFAAHHGHLAPQSARGQAHSTTLRAIPAFRESASVLECGGPPPLFPAAPINRPFVSPGARSIAPRVKKRKPTIFSDRAVAVCKDPSAKASLHAVFACNLPRRAWSDAPCLYRSLAVSKIALI